MLYHYKIATGEYGAGNPLDDVLYSTSIMTQEKLNELIKLADKGICLHCGDRINRDRVRCNFCKRNITITDKKE